MGLPAAVCCERLRLRLGRLQPPMGSIYLTIPAMKSGLAGHAHAHAHACSDTHLWLGHARDHETPQLAQDRAKQLLAGSTRRQGAVGSWRHRRAEGEAIVSCWGWHHCSKVHPADLAVRADTQHTHRLLVMVCRDASHESRLHFKHQAKPRQQQAAPRATKTAGGSWTTQHIKLLVASGRRKIAPGYNPRQLLA